VAPAKNKQGRPTNILLPRLVMGNPPRDYAVKFKDGNLLNIQKGNLYLVRYCQLAIRKDKRLRELAKERKRHDFNPQKKGGDLVLKESWNLPQASLSGVRKPFVKKRS
jgi:hypothetical protein